MRSAGANNKTILLGLVSVVCYLLFAWHLRRDNFTELIGLYSILFLSFYFLVKAEITQPKFLFGIGLLFRLLLLFSIPNLSQDFYRFIWDGRMLLHGNNPYLYLPDNLIKGPGFFMPEAKELHNGMGSLSSGHYTNYPPVNQLCFALAALFAGKSIFGSVIVFKIIIILSDIGIYFFGKRILQHFRLPEKNIFLYFLNPLVIIELTGNLHFEGVMVFFLVLAFYLLAQNKQRLSAISMALSIAVKLVPLMLLPLLLRHLNFKQIIQYYFAAGITLLVLFLPFFSKSFFTNYTDTVALWFVNFEFNASIYYIIREIGYYKTGYNIIHAVGKIMPFIILFVILVFSLLKRNKAFQPLVTNMLLALSFYFFLSTTVHPWYIITPLALSLFTSYRFPVIWSFTVMFSYYAYSNPSFKENRWLLLAEYSVVFFSLIWELSGRELFFSTNKSQNRQEIIL
jgi:hypothetical protein